MPPQVIGEDVVQGLTQPEIAVRIFADLNWVIEEPDTTMAYYEKVTTTPGVTDVLDLLFWDYWLKTEQWGKILDYVRRHRWLSNPPPDGAREDFTSRADGLFFAFLRSKDVPNMLKLLDLLDGLTDGKDKRFALKCISSFYREEAPTDVQRRIDQL